MTFQPWVFDPFDFGPDIFASDGSNVMLDIPLDSTTLDIPLDSTTLDIPPDSTTLDIPSDNASSLPPTDSTPTPLALAGTSEDAATLKRSRTGSLGEGDQDDSITKRIKVADPSLGVRALKAQFPELYQVVVWAKAYYRSHCLSKSPYLTRGPKVDLAGDVHATALTLSQCKNFQVRDDHPKHDSILSLVSHNMWLTFYSHNY
jgi:hypothetical protein